MSRMLGELEHEVEKANDTLSGQQSTRFASGNDFPMTLSYAKFGKSSHLTCVFILRHEKHAFLGQRSLLKDNILLGKLKLTD